MRKTIPTPTRAFTADHLTTPQPIRVSGDVAGASGGRFDGTSPVDIDVTLPVVNGNVGVFGDSTHVSRVTVNAKGQVTAASSVAIAYPADTGITQLTGDVTAGPGSGSQAATLAATAVSAGSYGDASHYTTFTVDAKGRLTAAASVAVPGGASAANPTAEVGPAAVNGAAVTYMRSDAAPKLADTAVTPGAYTAANITVDQQGRITAAANGSGGSGTPGGTSGQVQYNNAGAFGGFTLSGDATLVASTGVITLANTAVTPASYTYASVTVDSKGRITSASSGAAPPSAANPTATGSDTAVNGSAATFMRSDGAPAIQKGSSSAFGLVKVDGTTITAAAGVISAVGGGGGVTAPTIRGSGIQSSSAGSYTVSWPVGTAAGDLALIFVGGGFGANGPTGWIVLNTAGGSNWLGSIFYRVLNATDISNGSVTITMTGTFNTVIGIVTFIGVTGGIRIPILPPFVTQVAGAYTVASQNATGSASRTLTLDGSARTTDMIVYFGSNRNNSVDTVSLGSALQTISATAASGVLTAASPGSNGGVAPVFSYTVVSGTTGDYQCAVVVKGL